MAATATRLVASPTFDDRLDASLEDFERHAHSPALSIPSQHSGFRSSDASTSDAEEEEEIVSNEPWSPPAWRASAGEWYRHQPYPRDRVRTSKSASEDRSRETSHESYESAVEEDEDVTTRPANIPLPRSSASPAKDLHPSDVKKQSSSPITYLGSKSDVDTLGTKQVDEQSDLPDNKNNFIRFALRAEVQQHTEPIEAVINWLRTSFKHATKSWYSLSSSILTAILAITFLRVITQTPKLPPSPDLVKVAGLARSFEPLIFYSEHGVRQIGDLQETGVAVWDLGESVRHANMTSTPLIINALDSLSESLKGLAIELTKFFANVDGDIDGILIVMDWAKRELDALSRDQGSSLSTAFTNIHSMLSTAGIFENRATGTPTALGKMFTNIFGSTRSQRTHTTLHRTFNEFLGVLEESINSELSYSTALFSLFESIDRQFLNLQRTVIREKDTQEREEIEFLGSLWVRIVGPNKIRMNKYDKNKQLLASVRAKTTQNKSLLQEHNTKLLALKGNLEMLRRKLMSPLVSRKDGSSLSVQEQVRGLEGTYEHLRRQREKQKGRMLEAIYGAGSGRRSSIGRDGDGDYAEVDAV